MIETETPNTPQTASPTPLNGSINAVSDSQAVQPLPAPEVLQNEDRMALELGKMQRQLAVAQAEKALAQTEASEGKFEALLLRLYLKYGLDPAKDRINENGVITRNFQPNQGTK